MTLRTQLARLAVHLYTVIEGAGEAGAFNVQVQRFYTHQAGRRFTLRARLISWAAGFAQGLLAASEAAASRVSIQSGARHAPVPLPRASQRLIDNASRRVA